jgi:hypothetical protein
MGDEINAGIWRAAARRNNEQAMDILFATLPPTITANLR